MFRCSEACLIAGKLLKDSLKRQTQAAVRPLSAKMADKNKFKLPARYGKGEKSVWVEYIQLNADLKPEVNLGQGFPDYDAPPKYVIENLATVAREDPLLNQYTRGYGHPRLVKALAELYSKLICKPIDPFTEVLVSSGAYEALYASILGHVDVGDEVIIIEPYFDCYAPMVRAAGGIPKFIKLKPTHSCGSCISSDDWKLDECTLRKLFNQKTKMIIVNTPHNPLGKVFTFKELQLIADLCKEHNVLCLSDEVYEWLVYEPAKHLRIASFPDMWERTITIGSAGKTFAVTGWKTGWAYGPADLMNNVFTVHQNCVYTHVTPIQEALARSFECEIKKLGRPDCFFHSLAQDLKPKRDYMIKFLVEAGFNPTCPEGGYFVVAGWENLEKNVDLSQEKDKFLDYKFTKYLTKKAGILTIPPSAFYGDDVPTDVQKNIRLCFIKKDEVLKKTEDLLIKWKECLPKTQGPC